MPDVWHQSETPTLELLEGRRPHDAGKPPYNSGVHEVRDHLGGIDAAKQVHKIMEHGVKYSRGYLPSWNINFFWGQSSGKHSSKLQVAPHHENGGPGGWEKKHLKNQKKTEPMWYTGIEQC